MADIIIVEDNAEIGNILLDFLRKEKYSACLATTGEKAIELFEKYWAKIVVLEVVLIIVFNIVLAVSFSNNVDRQYRVDISRIKQSLLEGETINVDEYDSIIKVEHFDENYNTNNDYAAVDCNDTFYFIEYRDDKENFSHLYMNMLWLVFCLL